MTDISQPSAAALSLLPERPAPSATPSQSSPAQSAVEALIRGNMGGGDSQKPSNPSELAAAGGDGSDKSTSKWTDADLQAAQAYLGRFQAPAGALEGKLSRDEAIQWGLNLAEMQKGINAKTKARDDRISELEQTLVKLAAGAGKAHPEDRKSKDTAGEADIKALAEELGADASKIGPALERWLESRLPKGAPEAAGKQSDEALREVRELAVGSARKQLQDLFPGLRHDALYADVLDAMQSLNGPRYQQLPRGEREAAKMRDASMLVFGAPSQGVDPEKTETRDQVLRAQVPKPQSAVRDAKPKAGLDLAQSLIDQFKYA